MREPGSVDGFEEFRMNDGAVVVSRGVGVVAKDHFTRHHTDDGERTFKNETEKIFFKKKTFQEKILLEKNKIGKKFLKKSYLRNDDRLE